MNKKALGRRRGYKSWFVEPYLQVKLGLMFLIINLVYSLLAFGIFGYYIWDIYQAISIYFQLDSIQNQEILKKFAIPVAVGAVLTIVFVLTTIMVSVRYTYQIYGPLVSIHRFLDDLLEAKKPESLQLRESDQLQDLAEKLNSLAERYNSDQRSQAMLPIYRFLDDVLSGKPTGELKLRDGDGLKELADKLNQIVQKIK